MCRCFPVPGVLVLCLSSLSASSPPVRAVDDAETFTGGLAASATVDVRPHVSGTLAKVLFKEGSQVKKGDVLFEMDPAPYQAAVNRAEADLALAEARLKRTEADLRRAEQLAARRAMSREEYDKHVSDRAEAAAAMGVARAQLEQARALLQHTRVVAPISGQAGQVFVDAGNLVRGGEAGPVLVTLVSTDPIYVYFEMDERSLLRYQKTARAKKAQDARTPIAVGLAGEAGFPHKGVIDFLDNRVNPDTGTIRVRGVMPNPDGRFTPGLSARVRLQLGKKGPGR
jgi:RND family efflux transporter MFP subunit